MNVFYLLLFVFVFSVFSYLIYNSYYFNIILHKKKLKNSFLTSFCDSVKGTFSESGYFAISHPVVPKNEFSSFSNRHKMSFSKCYSIVKFKTTDANWELFFHLIKEDSKFSEVLTIRVFPKTYRIKSEGNVEKNYSRLNIFTNNRYLTHILEMTETRDSLKWLIRYNGDILLVSGNNLHFKAFLSNGDLSAQRVLDMVKSMNSIKDKIFKKDVLEY